MRLSLESKAYRLNRGGYKSYKDSKLQFPPSACYVVAGAFEHTAMLPCGERSPIGAMLDHQSERDPFPEASRQFHVHADEAIVT